MSRADGLVPALPEGCWVATGLDGYYFDLILDAPFGAGSHQASAFDLALLAGLCCPSCGALYTGDVCGCCAGYERDAALEALAAGQIFDHLGYGLFEEDVT
jgi:hypothetical protein